MAAYQASCYCRYLQPRLTEHQGIRDALLDRIHLPAPRQTLSPRVAARTRASMQFTRRPVRVRVRRSKSSTPSSRQLEHRKSPRPASGRFPSRAVANALHPASKNIRLPATSPVPDRGRASTPPAVFKVALGEGGIEIVLWPAQPRSRVEHFLPQPAGILVSLNRSNS